MHNAQILKVLIREMINEMAFGGSSKKVINKVTHNDPKGHYPALSKYHSSKAYKKSATYAFKNFRTNVLIIPAFVPGAFGGSRVSIIPFNKAEDYLIEADMDDMPEDPQAKLIAFKNHLDSGGSIIISQSQSLVKGFWPSPWMIIHAMVDDIENEDITQFHQRFLRAFVEPLENWEYTIRQYLINLYENYLSEKNDSEGRIYLLHDIFIELLKWGMTMKSARENLLGSINDIYAESFVQAITHPRGFHLNLQNFQTKAESLCKLYDVTPEQHFIDLIQQKIIEYESLVNSLRDKALNILDTGMAGKIITISVADTSYGFAPDYTKK
jgi:hypothetical protein